LLTDFVSVYLVVFVAASFTVTVTKTGWLGSNTGTVAGTSTICNVVATYPESDICLKLYDAWYGEYYTDQTLHCMYPDLEPMCGYAATVWYSEASEKYENDCWFVTGTFRFN
jgi:hypothetical protein